jgi:hypothetical protein
MKAPFYDIEPGDDSHYLCANGRPIARFDELAKAEAVRDALVAEQAERLEVTLTLNGTAAPCPTKSGSGDLSDEAKVQSKNAVANGQRQVRRCQKLRHATRRLAEQHAESVRKRNGERLHAYVCNYCGGWHVGHRTAAKEAGK